MARGPTDPGRRDRIAAAALEIALGQGVHAVSHRTVAAAAGVPLGSTTYHFRTLDDLLSVAMGQAGQSYRAELEIWEAKLGPGADLAEAIADHIAGALDHDRARVVAEYELYLASIRRPQLAPASASWAAQFTRVLERRTDPPTARALTMLADGALMHALATGTDPDRDELVALLRRVIA
ncbi:TetR/AcrR family transcriptional regulator [Capillimicrobium parvum]|uniref:HTH-type transcriptional regulator RcdA n=1 Tax=Capillimicrobium parvum TaxID=2884022 RepID=A0A9E7C368_9ACTN|nr:TetR family transcriptional regulator [Capillimicrobium parvum]UGS38444.1 HTH-type transcriptional regulator RcdA [Capillimicrobium parvum]